MIRYSLLVLNPPAHGQAAASALRFAAAALARGHAIAEVFFYGDGTTALLRGEVASDELDVLAAFEALAACHAFPLRACGAAAERRGLDRLPDTVRSRVEAGTLGQLMVALDRTDRLVTFAS